MAEFWGFMPDDGNAFFISYNSFDWQRIAPVAKALKDMGYPIWYDYGLEAGTARWKAQISSAIDRCSAVILFVTRGIFDRERCYVLNEHDEAAGIKKPVIPVFLDVIDLAFVPTDYRSYVAEWQNIPNVPYLFEMPSQTAARISEVIARNNSVNVMSQNRSLQSVYLNNLPQGPANSSGQKKKTSIVVKIIAMAAVIMIGLMLLPILSGRNTDHQQTTVPSQPTDITTVQTESTTTRTESTTEQTETSATQTETSATQPVTGYSYSDYDSGYVGDLVVFGNYPQNTDQFEPIVWKVIDVQGSTVTLISEYLLDAHRFDDADKDWETSEVREWLNNDFLNTAFDPAEQQELIEIHGDKVTLLNKENMVPCFINDYDRVAAPTAYAIRNGAGVAEHATTDSGMNPGWWWILENDDEFGLCAWFVLSGGEIPDRRLEPENDSICVRPVVSVPVTAVKYIEGQY